MFLVEEFRHLKLQLQDVISATDNFDSNKLIGHGGFGKVYKGELSLYEKPCMVAFKRLDSKFGQGNTEFWKEIMMLSKYKHENLVSLLYFCFEGDERILVYEYASRGSLDRYLSDVSLTWTQRLKICVGVARGLSYLHDSMETKQRVLHRDIKSSNILLDEEWNAKVSDFGLSKVGPANQPQTFLISNVVGTFGYCDPSYFETGFLSKESDVYSFGVVLFEVICGRLCCEYRKGEMIRILVPMWRKCFDENRLDDVIFDNLKQQAQHDSLMTFSTVANRCLQRDHKKRPTMVEIVEELEIAIEQQLEISIIKGNDERKHVGLKLQPTTCETTTTSVFQELDTNHNTIIPDIQTNKRRRKGDNNTSLKEILNTNYSFADDHSFQIPHSDFGSKLELGSRNDMKMLPPIFDARVTEKPSSGDGGEQQRRLLSLVERSKAWWEYYNNEEYSDEDFKKAFRMTKSTFNIICDELSHDVVTEDDTMLGLAIPVRKRVAACLYYLATGHHPFGMGIYMPHKLVLEVCTAIKNVLMPKFLQWPYDHEQRLEEIKTEFQSISGGIPNVSGSIYTTHIPIMSSEVTPVEYFNKLHTQRNRIPSYTTTVQGVVDSRGVFTDICVGYPGSMSDDKILEKSALYQRFNTGNYPKDTWVVGNSGYPLLDWLLVPYTHPNLTSSQHSFNEKMEGIQKIGKDAFMRLKGRWTCLQKPTTVNLQDFPVVLEACCVLHNICEIKGEDMDANLRFYLFDDEIPLAEKGSGKSVIALQARDSIAHNLLRCSDGGKEKSKKTQ